MAGADKCIKVAEGRPSMPFARELIRQFHDTANDTVRTQTRRNK